MSVKRKSRTTSVNMRANGANKRLVGCGLLSITTPVSLLVKKFDVSSVLHTQKSLAAVNQISVIHEAMNGCKKLKIY